MGKEGKKEIYPLKNLIYCFHCNSEIMPFKNTGVRYYRCRGYNKKICSAKTIRAEVIEKKIFSLFLIYARTYSNLINPDNFEFDGEEEVIKKKTDLFFSLPEGIIDAKTYINFTVLKTDDILYKLSKVLSQIDPENLSKETEYMGALDVFKNFIDLMYLDIESGHGILKFKDFNIFEKLIIKFQCQT